MKTLASAIMFSAITLGTLASASAAAVEPATMGDTSKGKAWVDAKGMTLYTFGKDTKTSSNCNGKCSVEWPPLSASATEKAAGDWSIIKRADGTLQWAYEGHPFYTFIKDKKAGDVTGDGDDGFHLAK